MTKVSAKMIREYVKSQNFTSTEDIMEAMMDMFKDVLQQVMECELANELGYEKVKERRMKNVAISRKVTETATQKRRSKHSLESLILRFRGIETVNMNIK